MAETSDMRDRAKKAVLRLLATYPQTPDTNTDGDAGLGEAGWLQLDEMVEQHLLAPLLHHLNTERKSAVTVPTALRVKFAEAYRAAAFRALTVQAALLKIDALLRAEGIVYAALKGARLTWHAYPHPALRPMRDIDIVVSPADAVHTYRLLLKNGYERYANRTTPEELALENSKHLPPIRHLETNVQIELHAHLFRKELSAQPNAHMLNTPALLDRRIELPLGSSRISFLGHEETLLHLVIHSVYDSKFSNGPIVLSDLHYLLASNEIDWPRFWEMARQGGWVAGCHLAFGLLERYHGSHKIEWPAGEQFDLPGPVLDDAAVSMLLNKTRFKDIDLELNLMGADNRKSFISAIKLLFPSKYQLRDFAKTSSDSPLIWALYPVWLISRAFEFLANRLNRGQRTELSEIAHVVVWLKAQRK